MVGRRLAILSLVLAGVAAAPSTAFADEPPPLVEQYVEAVPSASGAKGLGAARGKTRKLSPGVQQSLRRQAGVDAATLEAIATSAVYGAPRTKVKPQATSASKRRSASPALDTLAPSSDSSDGRLIALAIVLFLSALGAAFVWRLRRRSAQT